MYVMRNDPSVTIADQAKAAFSRGRLYSRTYNTKSVTPKIIGTAKQLNMSNGFVTESTGTGLFEIISTKPAKIAVKIMKTGIERNPPSKPKPIDARILIARLDLFSATVMILLLN